jgi:mannose-6-phosphate isomerase-like protein (cupin superfamily)
MKASGQVTGGALSVFDTQVDTGPPLHVHEHEDESCYVLAGEISVRCGTEVFDAGPGSFVFLPRGRPHRFWAKSGTARLLLIAVPGGVEDYFREINTASTEADFTEVGERYGIRVVPE